MKRIHLFIVAFVTALSVSLVYAANKVYVIDTGMSAATEQEIREYCGNNTLAGGDGNNIYIRSKGDVVFAQKLVSANENPILHLQSQPNMSTPVALSFNEGLGVVGATRLDSTNLTTTIKGTSSFEGLVTQTAGKTTFRDGVVTFGTESAFGEYKFDGKSGTARAPSEVYVTNTVWHQVKDSSASTAGGLSIAGGNSGAHAVFTVDSESVVTDRVAAVGCAQGAYGAIYQYGGDVVNTFAADTGIGWGGYGYQELRGGTFTSLAADGAHPAIQRGGMFSYGAFVQKGGVYTGNPTFGRSSNASASGAGDFVGYIGGGTFLHGQVVLGDEDGNNRNGGGGHAWLTVSGTNALLESAGVVNLGSLTNYTAQINLNDGGTLKVTGGGGYQRLHGIGRRHYRFVCDRGPCIAQSLFEFQRRRVRLGGRPNVQ